MEFFGINRHIPHLVDVATVTLFLEIAVRAECSEWFLDFTNPLGESLIVGSESVRAYRLLINDAKVQHEDLPVLYDSLRRREYHDVATSVADLACSDANLFDNLWLVGIS
jgi:hypothetical protein